MWNLKVGQARRLAIISKQDKTLKELESKLASQVDDRNTHSPGDNAQVSHDTSTKDIVHVCHTVVAVSG